MNRQQWIEALTNWLVRRQERYILNDGELHPEELKHEIMEFIKSRQVYDNEASIEGFGLRHREPNV